MSKEDSSLDQDKEEAHGTSIATSISTSFISREVTLDTHDDPHSNSNCKLSSIFFEDSEASITHKGVNINSLKENTT